VSRNKSAFQFMGSIANKVSRGTGLKTASKANVVLLVIDTTLDVVDAGISIYKYSSAVGQTKHMAGKIKEVKWKVDATVQEEENQSKIIIEETRKRMHEEMQLLRVKLKTEKDQFLKDMELMNRKNDLDQEEFWKKWKIQEKIRNPIFEILAKVERMIKFEREHNNDFSKLAELEEDYRLAANHYEKLIKNL